MQVKKAYSPREFSAIASLRYEVNIAELQKEFMLNSLRKDSIWNVKDQEATHLYVEHESKIIGALRVVFKRFDNTLEERFKIKAPFFETQFSVVDSLIIQKEFRKSRAAYLLAREIYCFGIRNGVQSCLIEAEDHLVGFYQKLGFRKYRVVKYPYGTRNQLMLNLFDFEHLITMNSPFLNDLKKHNQSVNEIIEFECPKSKCAGDRCKNMSCANITHK